MASTTRVAVALSGTIVLGSACGGTKNEARPQPVTAPEPTSSRPPSPAKAPPMTKLTPNEMIKPPTTVASLLGLRDLTREQVLSLMQVAPDAVVNDVAYEKVTGVSRVTKGSVFPGHFFLRGAEVAMVYVGDPSFLDSLTPAGIEQELGGKGTILRSRIGKTSNQHVYPDRGFAFAETDDVVEMVEVFSPMSLEDYQARIYNDPGPFIR